MVMLSLIFGGP